MTLPGSSPASPLDPIPWPDLDVMGDIGLAHAAIATLGTIIFVGVSFLARPSRSALLWSLMFMGMMMACFGYLAAVAAESEQLRRGSLGVLLGASALLWSGLRAYRGRRSYPWLSPLIAAIAVIAFLAVGDSGWYALAYRIAYFASAVFAALFLLEWFGMPERRERILIPVVAASTLYAVSGAAVLLGAFFDGPSVSDTFGELRVFNSVGMLVTMVCVLVSLVPLSTPGSRMLDSGPAQSGWGRLSTTVRGRLASAHERGESGWSFVRIELDDADDIREAGGIAIFGRLIGDIHTRVRAVLPTEADVAVTPDGAVVALIPRPEAVVRELLRKALELIAVRNPAAPITVTTSASVGWATVAVSGYDLDVLQAVTAEAAATARADGGDRWQRVEA